MHPFFPFFGSGRGWESSNLKALSFCLCRSPDNRRRVPSSHLTQRCAGPQACDPHTVPLKTLVYGQRLSLKLNLPSLFSLSFSALLFLEPLISSSLINTASTNCFPFQNSQTFSPLTGFSVKGEREKPTWFALILDFALHPISKVSHQIKPCLYL